MKSLNYLVKYVFQDMESRCRVSTSQDLKRVLARIEEEGDSFLTISLPSFGKDLEKGLDQGFVDRSLFQGFNWKGGLPQFLGGFLDLIFDRGTGMLLPVPDITAIQAIRQFTLMWAKIERPVTKRRQESAINKYMECEQDVRSHDKEFNGSIVSEFQTMSSRLWSGIYSRIEGDLFKDTFFIPKHGPGSTADGLLGNAKWNQSEWTDRLEYIFPSWRYSSPRASFHQIPSSGSEERSFTHLDPGSERPVEVILVPKTMKTPRIIAREPVVMQYIQQALQTRFKEEFRKDYFASSFICYDSQIPNQDMARIGSSLGTFATLDLSEASDRVSNQHVRAMLSRFPLLGEAVDACRSRKADVPGHGVIRLAKFSSMGSALCFPFEAMVFCTVVFMAIQKCLNIQLTPKLLQSFRGQVRVYGDDIIVPTEFAHSVARYLELFGFKVNSSKSFWTGKFRESCGKEFYAGSDVSITKIRRDLPSQRRHVPEIVSTVALRNQLYKAGYYNTAEALDTVIEEFIPFPIVEESSQCLGKWSYEPPKAERMHPHLQYPLVMGAVLVPRPRASKLEGPGALLKWFLQKESSNLPFDDPRHLEYAGRPVAVDIKRRWVRTF